MTSGQSDIALKEWAVICRALETGQQTLLLRKGGIAEGAGGFRAEHDRFWLYPTQFHQGAEQLEPAFAPLLAEVDQLRTESGQVVVRSFAVVQQVEYLTQLDRALALCGLHGWTQQVVEQRFGYRQPGLYLFVLRAYRSKTAIAVFETAAMAGCKSWVELPERLSTDELQPVLSDEQFAKSLAEIRSKVTL